MSTVVDGTAKLAAKSNPNDKHEAPDLNIEEATIASPRPSRKRAGDYFDFVGGANAEPSSKSADSKAAKPKRTAETAPAEKDEKSHEVEARPVATAKRGKKGQGAKKEVAGSTSDTTTKPVEKGKRLRKSKVAEDDLAGEKPESSKKSKKATKELAAERSPKPHATPKTAKAETKTKAKKSKAKRGTAEQESSAVLPDVVMDEGPLETLLQSDKGHATEAAEKQPATGAQATKAAKTAKKPAKESKASKLESAKASAAEIVADGANLTKKGAKAGAEIVKKASRMKAPAIETAADVTGSLKKGATVATDKAEQAVEYIPPAAETLAGVTDVAKKDVRARTTKMKTGAKSKESRTAKDDASVKPTETTEEQKTEASGSRKRKAPASADTEALKTEILDPLSEHASATKKQKNATTESKSIKDTVGELLATATEGANAARASLGGLATSIMGGASEAAEGAMGAKKSVKASAKKVKGKGKATTEDVTKSSGKIAANEGPGTAGSEDDSNDEPDDHTAALLAGFESDGDEGIVLGSGFKEGQKIPTVPQEEKTAKMLEDVKKGAVEGPGVVYVGRIPHGFYEHEMREYFSQFGDINRLRLSRNRKSGASKHYAFIEFNSAGVAKIVADTMNNYLMFGHILRCKVIPKEQLQETLWKGADKRFKAVPWNKIEGRKLEMGLGREQWAGRIEEEKKRRASKNEKTKAIGYEFETGELKGVDQVPVRDAAKKIDDGDKVEEEMSLVTAGGRTGNGAVVVSEEVKIKRVKKVKGKLEETTTAGSSKTKRALDAGAEIVGSAAKKARQGNNAAT